MTKQLIFRIGMIILLTGVLQGCNKWSDHNALTDTETGKNIFQQIQEDPALSRFAGLLVKSGYDQVIASSQNYTVFAPVNEALSSLDPALESDTAKLRLFVGNHITSQLLKVTDNSQERVPMINGKCNNLLGNVIDNATIITANRYSKNGLLQVINKTMPAYSSAWEWLRTDPLMPSLQKTFLLSQTDSAGYTFLTKVADLSNEKKQFTFFVLADTAWSKEVNRYKPFFTTITGNADSTANAAAKAVAWDLAVEGVYQPDVIPDTILSAFNTKVGINKSNIAQTVKLSNGIVYIMRSLEVLPRHKFQSIVIQGEQYDFYRLNRLNVTYLRDRYNPLTGKDFRDVLVFDHNTAQFYLGYRLKNIPALKFRAYWVALHDNINGNTASFKQLLGIGSYASTSLSYTTVLPNDYSEVYLGDFNIQYYSPDLNIYLTADNNTNDDLNKITVDYIRLEPVL